MSISIASDKGKVAYNVQEYMLDYQEDVKNLPYTDCAPCSSAYVIENGNVYIKNSKGEWVKQ